MRTAIGGEGFSPCLHELILLIVTPRLPQGSSRRSGPGHPHPGFEDTVAQHRSAWTTRRNTPCHSFHDSSRSTSRRPPRTTWHGIWMIAATNRLNSIRKSVRFCSRCAATCRGCSGTDSANHAFRFHARAVITMYAQLLVRLSTAARNAWAPPLSCAIRFSWSHRSLALNTTSLRVPLGSLVG